MWFQTQLLGKDHLQSNTNSITKVFSKPGWFTWPLWAWVYESVWWRFQLCWEKYWNWNFCCLLDEEEMLEGWELWRLPQNAPSACGCLFRSANKQRQSFQADNVITSKPGVTNSHAIDTDRMKPVQLESPQPSSRGKTHSASYKVVPVIYLLLIWKILEIQTFWEKETLYF